MKKKKGFTLVELLAVIAILAILVIIALPNVINMYNKAQKETFLTEAKKVYTEAEKKYISSSITENAVKTISSTDNSKLDMTGEKLQYCVVLNNNGKVKSMKVSNRKWFATLYNGSDIEDLTIDSLETGNLDNYKCSSSQSNVQKPIYCTFDGELTQGAEYVNGQYTYRYMQEKNVPSNSSINKWVNMDIDGWGVSLTDLKSADPVSSSICSYINNKPIVSMSGMYFWSNATSIDLSKVNTSNVVNMSGMFEQTKITTLDVSNFNTSKVTDMSHMFQTCRATTINGLDKLDTSSVTDMSFMFYYSFAPLNLSNFDTSNVTNMEWMFAYSRTEVVDLSGLDTSKVTNMSDMFLNSKTQTIHLDGIKTQNVTDMSGMFSNSKVITLTGLDSFDTSKVTNMGSMFWDCPANEINVKKFNTKNVTNMNRMFGITNVSTLDLSSFDMENVQGTSEMFYLAKATTGYAKSSKDANILNKSSDKPTKLTFVEKK